MDDLEHGLRVAGPGSDYVRKLDELKRMQIGGNQPGDVQVALKAADTHELIARIRARLPGEVQQLGPILRIDRRARLVERLDGDVWNEVLLQPRKFRVLTALVDADGAVVGTFDLFERAFQSDSDDPGEDTEAGDYRNRVWVCIANLRKRISSDQVTDRIQTVHGIGYRLKTSAR